MLASPHTPNTHARSVSLRPSVLFLAGNAATVSIADTAEQPRALEAQTARRAARRAEREKGVKARAIAAAESLGQEEAEGLKMIPLADSVSFARDYKLGMAKKARKSGGWREGGS